MALVLNGKSVPDKWVPLLAEYAKAYQETGVSGKRWYEENYQGEHNYKTINRYISKSLAQAYLDQVKPAKTAKNRKKSPPKTAKNRTTAKSQTAKNRTTENAHPENAIPEQSQKSKPTQKIDRGAPARSKLPANQSGAKRNPNMARPLNQNAVTHGIYARQLIEEEQSLYAETFGQTQVLEHELAVARVRLARALAMDADLRTLDKMIASGATGGEVKAFLNHSPLELDTWEWFDGETTDNPLSGERWIKKRPDMNAAIDRLLGRIANLESLIYRMSEGLPLKRNEQIAYQSAVFEQLKASDITPVEAGRLLESQGMQVPTALALEIRNELANPAIDEDGGITEEELDRIVAQGREHREQQQTFLAERREWIEERFAEDV